MENRRPVRCSENEEIALYLLKKRQEVADPNGISENLDMTISNAYRNICSSKTPIRTLKDLSQIKGVGKWILRIMKEFFPESPAPSGDSPSKNVAQKGKKAKRPKHYVPQKNSVAYALLITLYREMANGNSFMKKQELVDAAEASGLSRKAIAPDKSKGKPGQFGNSSRDWYTGWSCMKTLVSKGLVVKSSCPAKYMLTEEGQEASRECIMRSGLSDSSVQLMTKIGSNSFLDEERASHSDITDRESTFPSLSQSSQKELNDISISNFGGDIIVSSESDSDPDHAEHVEGGCLSTATLNTCSSLNTYSNSGFVIAGSHCQNTVPNNLALTSFNPRPCTSHSSLAVDAVEHDMNVLAMPPRQFGEKFEDTYDVILILDDRENFGARSKKVIDNIQSQFKVLVEVRRLPVGDGIWIVRHRKSNKEYVLDFIVERKKVDDLCSSIRDNRYKDQKLRLQRCGLQKLIYLVEGDPNSLETAESIKTACFTTEILEGFDVQRTSGFADTVRKYRHLTKLIAQYYSTCFSSDRYGDMICPTFNDFVKKCQDLEKMTVRDVFALQLMQVPQVTEEIALAVVKLYPTIWSLGRAYSRLEGDIHAQEGMLRNQCKAISGGASKNIYKLVWGS